MAGGVEIEAHTERTGLRGKAETWGEHRALEGSPRAMLEGGGEKRKLMQAAETGAPGEPAL